MDGIKILWITGIDVPTAMIYKFVTRKNVKKAILDLNMELISGIKFSENNYLHFRQGVKLI